MVKNRVLPFFFRSFILLSFVELRRMAADLALPKENPDHTLLTSDITLVKSDGHIPIGDAIGLAFE